MLLGCGSKLVARFILVTVGVVIWLAMVSCNSAPSSAPPEANPATPTKTDVEAQRKRAARLAELKKHFNIKIDEFDKSTTYRHKAFSHYMNGNGTTLEADIVDNQLFVQSQYVADQWIFHDDFVVKVGNEQITAGGRTQHEVVSGVVETVSPNSSESQAVAEFIAKAGTTPVRVRLEGKFYKDYTLRPVHQKAIAETVELWHLMEQGTTP